MISTLQISTSSNYFDFKFGWNQLKLVEHSNIIPFSMMCKNFKRKCWLFLYPDHILKEKKKLESTDFWTDCIKIGATLQLFWFITNQNPNLEYK